MNKSNAAEEVADVSAPCAEVVDAIATDAAGAAGEAASAGCAAGTGAASAGDASTAGADGASVTNAAGAATFSWELPQTLNENEIPALDYERMRSDLELHFEDAFFGGCGNSIVFTSGIVLADEATLLQYAKEACFKLDKYKLNKQKGN